MLDFYFIKEQQRFALQVSPADGGDDDDQEQMFATKLYFEVFLPYKDNQY